MAKFCENNCKARCEFCKYYVTEINGNQICTLRKMYVDESDGYDCDYFECKNIKYSVDKLVD